MSGYDSYGSGGYGTKIQQESYVSLAVSSDTINVSHTLQFCRPVPNDHFNCPGNIPATTDCGVFTKELKNFPLNNLPSGGACTTDMRISNSEMCYVSLQLNNYPGSGTVNITWKNKDTGISFAPMSFSVPACGGNCSYTWWYYLVYEYVGHFDWEIDRSGNYQCIIDSTWGGATIDFIVTCTPTWACETPYNGFESDGCGNRRLNSICNAGSLVNGTFDSNLNGWTISADSNSSVSWTDGLTNPTCSSCGPTPFKGAVLLYSHNCGYCSIEQNFTFSKQYLSWDFFVATFSTPAICVAQLFVDGNYVWNVSFANNYIGWSPGRRILDTSSYINHAGKIKFYITPEAPCVTSENTYLWIDNVKEFNCYAPNTYLSVI